MSKSITHLIVVSQLEVRLVMQQVLLGSASLWAIFLTVKICLEKQIMRCSSPRKRFTAVPFGVVNYFCIYTVDLVKGVLKTS